MPDDLPEKVTGEPIWFTEQAVRRRVAEACHLSGRRQVLVWLKISPQYLGDFLAGKRQPGPKLLRGLGMVRVTRYQDLHCHD